MLISFAGAALHCPLGLATEIGEIPMKTIDKCACCHKETVYMTDSQNTLYNCLQAAECQEIMGKSKNTICQQKQKKFELFGRKIDRKVETCISKTDNFN
ncbi:unnamed protein product, partial [Mesorhabditis spiculigera]